MAQKVPRELNQPHVKSSADGYAILLLIIDERRKINLQLLNYFKVRRA